MAVQSNPARRPRCACRLPHGSLRHVWSSTRRAESCGSAAPAPELHRGEIGIMAAHSLRRPTIGSSRAARSAGYQPNTSPIAMDAAPATTNADACGTTLMPTR
jgi:hypothetical protein